MDKESLELQKEWTKSRIKRIKEEIKRYVEAKDKFNRLIVNDEKEIAQLEESLMYNTMEYFKDKPYEAIKHYVKEWGYSYSVDDVLEGYRKSKNGYYNSYTMNYCVENLKDYLEQIESN